VCSQPFEHTSVLQFLEKFTGVRESNISDCVWGLDCRLSLPGTGTRGTGATGYGRGAQPGPLFVRQSTQTGSSRRRSATAETRKRLPQSYREESGVVPVAIQVAQLVTTETNNFKRHVERLGTPDILLDAAESIRGLMAGNAAETTLFVVL
jgi:hypothetical protein